MDKSKKIIFVELIVIFALAFFLMKLIYFPVTPQTIEKISYCEKYQYEDKTCLLSPRVGILLSPNNHLLYNFDSVESDIQDYIDSNHLNVSIYVLNLRDGASFGIRGTREFEPASLNKLPIAMITLKKVERGELKLGDILPINYDDRDSRSGPLYNSTLNGMNVSNLLYYMLSESDNTAFRVLTEQEASISNIKELSIYTDYYTKEIKEGGNNTYLVSPKSVSNLFTSLYLSSDLKPENSELILSLLTNTTFDIKKYANLPEDVTVSQKYASYYVGEKSYFHDCGILYVKDSRISYCVMTEDLEKDKASEVIGNIVNKIYKYVSTNQG